MQNTQSFDDWEDEITSIIESDLATTRGDAQAIIEVHAFRINQCWTLGMSARDTALKIMTEARSASS